MKINFSLELTDEQMNLMVDEFIARYDLSQSDANRSFVRGALVRAIQSDIEVRLTDMVTEPGSFFRVSDVQFHSPQPIEFSDVDFIPSIPLVA